MGKRPRSLGPHDDECATAKAARELVCLDGPTRRDDARVPRAVALRAQARGRRRRDGRRAVDPAAKRRRAHDAAERFSRLWVARPALVVRSPARRGRGAALGRPAGAGAALGGGRRRPVRADHDARLGHVRRRRQGARPPHGHARRAQARARAGAEPFLRVEADVLARCPRTPTSSRRARCARAAARAVRRRRRRRRRRRPALAALAARLRDRPAHVPPRARRGRRRSRAPRSSTSSRRSARGSRTCTRSAAGTATSRRRTC